MKPIVGAVLGVLALASGPVFAQSYEIPWWTVDGGGAMGTSGATYTLSGTSGQADAGGPFTGGTYAAVGGFWSMTATGGGPQADLAVTKTDGQPSAIPGQLVTYTIVATNSGPDPVTGATVADTLPALLTGGSWTCVGASGGTCTASGSGHIADTVDLPVGATVTYTLTATIHPAASGALANTVTVTVPGGVTDPDPSDNSATDSDTLMPRADLAVDKSDSQDPVKAGEPLRYTIQVTNLGPSAATGMTLVDALPAGVYFVSVTPGSPTCVAVGQVVTCTLGGLLPATLHTVTIHVVVSPGVLGTISNTGTVTGNELDPAPANNEDAEPTTVGLGIESELVHGASLWADLASVFGDPDEDLFRIAQEPYSSYEVVVDGTSGDIGTGQGPQVARLDSDAINILQSSGAAGAGPSRSLRWENATAAVVDDQYVRVRSVGCTATCGPDDVYRIRAWDTTLVCPRFNNSGTQITILLLQNTTDRDVTGHAHFWSSTGVLVGTHAFSMGGKAAFVVNTSTVPGVSGVGGTLTLSHDGAYGTLLGKAVAVEPATGFTFDTPLLPRPR